MRLPSYLAALLRDNGARIRTWVLKGNEPCELLLLYAVIVLTGVAPARPFEHQPLKLACLLFHHRTVVGAILLKIGPFLAIAPNCRDTCLDRCLDSNGGVRSRTEILRAYEARKLPLLYTLFPTQDLHLELRFLRAAPLLIRPLGQMREVLYC